MLKLDFSKAYDSVSWRFLLKAMASMDIPAPFISMVRFLLEGATAAVSVNGASTASFSIERGVRQGCPLAPYLDFLVAETLSLAARRGVEQGSLRGIRLPGCGTQQILTQFADDATFLLFGSHRYMIAAFQLLQDFGQVTGLRINRAKCAIFYYGRDAQPGWLSTFGCQVAPPQTLYKMLGTPFGIDVATPNEDEFLQAKITKKLAYWSNLHLSLAGRSVVVNSVLLSTLWYFLSIWAGSKDILRKI